MISFLFIPYISGSFKTGPIFPVFDVNVCETGANPHPALAIDFVPNELDSDPLLLAEKVDPLYCPTGVALGEPKLPVAGCPIGGGGVYVDPTAVGNCIPPLFAPFNFS